MTTHVITKQGVTDLPPLEESRPEIRGSRESEIRELFLEIVFALPSSFLFREIGPLNLEELDSTLPCDTRTGIQNAKRLLTVSQVLVQVNGPEVNTGVCWLL